MIEKRINMIYIRKENPTVRHAYGVRFKKRPQLHVSNLAECAFKQLTYNLLPVAEIDLNDYHACITLV